MILSRVLQFLIWCFGISFFIWAFFDPRFRGAEGFLKGGFCLPFAFGVAFMILGWLIAGRLKGFALWLALAIIGQAVALQMIDAGPLVHYQHYRSFGRLLVGNDSLLLIMLAAQTALVAVGFRTRWPTIRAWLGRSFKTWQLFGIGLIFLLSSAAVSRNISVYITELLLALLCRL